MYVYIYVCFFFMSMLCTGQLSTGSAFGAAGRVASYTLWCPNSPPSQAEQRQLTNHTPLIETAELHRKDEHTDTCCIHLMV